MNVSRHSVLLANRSSTQYIHNSWINYHPPTPMLHHWITILVSSSLVLLASHIHQPASPATNLKTEMVENKLGLQLHEFAFSWESTGQRSYQIIVASNEKKLAADEGDLWDSGRRYTRAHSEIMYMGLPLMPGHSAWWKVRIWDEADDKGRYSEPARIDIPEALNNEGRTLNHVAFIGGTLFSRMEKYGYLETAITANWPQHHITFRNLGWPADDVRGTARGEFGSLRNTRSWRPPTEEEGLAFNVLMDHVTEAMPSALLVAYGSEAAFANTEVAMEAFEADYEKLITTLVNTGATISLLTPTPHCNAEFLQDPGEANGRLANAAAFIRAMGEEKGVQVIDLYTHFLDERCTRVENDGDETLYDKNGIHLTEAGYKKLAQFVSSELGVSDGAIEVSLTSAGEITFSQGGLMTNFYELPSGVRFDVKRDRLPAPWTVNSISILETDAPQQVKINGRLNDQNADAFASDVEQGQFESLRQTIIEKNRFYRDKMRPLNLAYIYLFRRHEMGHLAREQEDLNELVEGHEQVIAHLRVPNRYRYEVKQAENWKAPRNYPDHEVPQYVPEPNIAEELASFTLSDSLEINLFSGDPLIANPINLNWDTRGRAWISTSSTYPHLKPGDAPNDRIVILEDWDQDGVADTAKVFAEGLLVPHSVMPVPGGAYVASTTELLFLADHDGDDVADERRVVYSGFGNADVHHMIHGLTWAPWGDLHFTQSIYINSFIETAFGPRRLNGSGIWSFRPETERLDIFARGMTNPWGFALNKWGQSFATDGAGGAGPHYVFPGVKHPTAVGAHRVLPGLIPGKPKNTAAAFISGRHMPEEWHGSLLANDYRANRMVRYVLEEKGSGYTAHEAQTMLHSSHRSFRPVDIKMGPDGAFYVVDWYNPIIDHGEVDFYHPLRDRSHGRIWRLTAKDSPLLTHPDMEGASIEALLDLLKAPEQYTREQANRELASRPADIVAERVAVWVNTLDKEEPAYEHHLLEAGWLHLAINKPDETVLQKLLKSNSPKVRAAAARMAPKTVSEADALRYLAGAVHDEHPQVRLETVNALRSMNSLDAVELALSVLDHDVDDNLAFALELTVRDLREQWIPPLLDGEPVFDNQNKVLYAVLEVSDARVMRTLLDYIKQDKIADADLPRAVRLVSSLGSKEEIKEVFDLSKQNLAILPEVAMGATSSSAVPDNASDLATLFGDSDVSVRMAAVKLAGIWKVESLGGQIAQLAKTSATAEEYMTATNALALLQDIDALKSLMDQNNSPGLRASAAGAWVQVAPDEAAESALGVLSSIKDARSSDVIIDAFLSSDEGVNTLNSVLSETDLPEDAAVAGIRAVRASGRYMGDLIEAFSKAGDLKPASIQMNQEERRELLSEISSGGDFSRGRRVYNETATQCNNCHVVDGNGKTFGPDLSSLGAYMTPASILESLLNPNTDIKQGYETLLIRKTDGSIVSGLLQRETEDATLIRIPGGTVISIPKDEISTIENSSYSLMPAGLTASIRRDELIDLMKYLTSLGTMEGE